MDPFVVKSCLVVHVAKDILKGLKFEEAQTMNYDPRTIVLNRKKSNRCGIFEHREIEGLRALANLESFKEYFQVTEVRNMMHNTQGVPLVVNPLIIGIQTPAKNDIVNKRPHEEFVEVQ